MLPKEGQLDHTTALATVPKFRLIISSLAFSVDSFDAYSECEHYNFLHVTRNNVPEMS